MTFKPEGIEIEVIEDKPERGMWHCGSNPAWVKITHIPTMASVTVYDEFQYKAREVAMSCLELIVNQSMKTECRYPERMQAK